MEFQWIPFSWPLLSALSPKLLTAVPWPSFFYLHRYRLNVKSDRFWRIFFFYSMYFFDILPINLSVCIYAEGAIKTRIHLRWAIFFLFSTQFLPNMVMQQKMHTEFSAIRLIHFRWCRKMVIIEIYFILFFITWNYLKILVDHNRNLFWEKIAIFQSKR